MNKIEINGDLLEKNNNLIKYSYGGGFKVIDNKKNNNKNLVNVKENYEDQNNLTKKEIYNKLGIKNEEDEFNLNFYNPENNYTCKDKSELADYLVSNIDKMRMKINYKKEKLENEIKNIKNDLELKNNANLYDNYNQNYHKNELVGFYNEDSNSKEKMEVIKYNEHNRIQEINHCFSSINKPTFEKINEMREKNSKRLALWEEKIYQKKFEIEEIENKKKMKLEKYNKNKDDYYEKENELNKTKKIKNTQKNHEETLYRKKFKNYLENKYKNESEDDNSDSEKNKKSESSSDYNEEFNQRNYKKKSNNKELYEYDKKNHDKYEKKMKGENYKNKNYEKNYNEKYNNNNDYKDDEFYKNSNKIYDKEYKKHYNKNYENDYDKRYDKDAHKKYNNNDFYEEEEEEYKKKKKNKDKKYKKYEEDKSYSKNYEKKNKKLKEKKINQKYKYKNEEDYSNRSKSRIEFHGNEKIKDRKFREYLQNKIQEDNNRNSYKFKANSLPKNLLESYDNIISKTQRLRLNKEEKAKYNLLKLKATEKPFNFQNRNKSFRKKEYNNNYSFTNEKFKAKEIPWYCSKVINIKETEEREKLRKERINKRARELLKLSKLPPRMEKHEKEKLRNFAYNTINFQNTNSNNNNDLLFHPKITKNIPNFEREQNKFQKVLEKNKKNKQPTKIQEFKFRETSNRKNKYAEFLEEENLKLMKTEEKKFNKLNQMNDINSKNYVNNNFVPKTTKNNKLLIEYNKNKKDESYRKKMEKETYYKEKNKEKLEREKLYRKRFINIEDKEFFDNEKLGDNDDDKKKNKEKNKKNKKLKNYKSIYDRLYDDKYKKIEKIEKMKILLNTYNVYTKNNLTLNDIKKDMSKEDYDLLEDALYLKKQKFFDKLKEVETFKKEKK